jgi:hypothetical protein
MTLPFDAVTKACVLLPLLREFGVREVSMVFISGK